MKSNIDKVCERIENLLSFYGVGDHELLYNETIKELQNVDFSGIFIQLENLPLYRVRLNKDTNELFDDVKEISYAPSKYVNNYGRVNRPNQSMFYCSEFESICELELLYDYLLDNDLGHERLGTYSNWQIVNNLNVLILAIAPPSGEFVNGFTLRKECFEFVKSEPKSIQERYSNLYNLTSTFFLRNAKEDRNVYVVCSAISNFFTQLFPNIDGVIYPTVQGYTGYNFVLRPHVIDGGLIKANSNLSMKKWIVKNEMKMEICPEYSNSGIIKGENINWSSK